MRTIISKPIYWLFSLMMLLAVSVNAQQDNRLHKANQLYADGDFDAAVEVYEDVLKSGMEAPQVYYNLGNAYYRKGLLPAAILNYERALLLAPQDKDIRYNLNLASGQITDKIEPVGVFFVTRWFASFRNSSDSDTWAIISVVSFLLFLAGLMFYFFARTSLFRKMAFFIALFSFLISATTLAFSNHQKQRLVNRDRAIVFSPSVTVRSAPEASGTELFVLHEGTKVKILQRINNWLEVELQDGSIGWMHEEHLEII